MLLNNDTVVADMNPRVDALKQDRGQVKSNVKELK